MAAQHGRTEGFDPETDEWTRYIKRLQQYFIANDIENEEKKKAILLQSVHS